MNRMTAPILLSSLLLPVTALADAKGQCGTGTFLDVQVTTEMIPIGTAENGERRQKKNGRTEYHTYSTTLTQEQKTYSVTVQLDDLVYTGESREVLGFGFKPTAFIVNDPIQACVRDNKLTLTRPDGKEYKAHIVRTARMAPSAPATTARP